MLRQKNFNTMIKLTILLLTLLAILSFGNTIKVTDNVSVSSDITTKFKRYFNHGVSSSLHKSPCPPFYPHLHENNSPMHLTRPYGPPAYPKSSYGLPSMPLHHTQYIHQPTYSNYMPKQMISYVKSHVVKPHYNYLPTKSSQIIHQSQPIHHIIQQQSQWQYQQPQQHYQKSHFAYAPIYDKSMVNHQQQHQHQYISYVKPMNYHAHPKPGIIYKMESMKCPLCYQHEIQHQSMQNHYQMPQIIHVKPIQSIQHQLPIYLPPSHEHIQSAAIKSIGHIAPCNK